MEWGGGHRRAAFPPEPLDQRAQIRGDLLHGDASRCSPRLRPPQTAEAEIWAAAKPRFFFSFLAPRSCHMCCAELDSPLIRRALWPPCLMERKLLPQKINLSHLDDNTFPQVMMLRRSEEADRVNCTFPAQPGSPLVEEKKKSLSRHMLDSVFATIFLIDSLGDKCKVSARHAAKRVYFPPRTLSFFSV